MADTKPTPLRCLRLIEDMRIKGLGESSQKAHIRAVRYLAEFLGRSPDTATTEDLRAYQLHMVDTNVTPSTYNARLVGLRIGADPSPAHPHDCARWWPVTGRHPLGCLQTWVLSACTRAVAAVPAIVCRRPDGSSPCRTIEVLRRHHRIGRGQRLRRMAHAVPQNGLGGLCQATLRRTGGRTGIPQPLHPPRRHLKPSPRQC